MSSEPLFGYPHAYCIDTSAWINFAQHQPFDIMLSLWGHFDKLIVEGRIVIPTEVYKEIEAGSDDLFEWMKTRKGMIVTLDSQQVDRVKEILEKHPNWLAQSGKNAADPFVVALGLARGYTVVTSESFNLNKPRIPKVCSDFNVACINEFDFLRKTGLKL